jgi:hypothetical protein
MTAPLSKVICASDEDITASNENSTESAMQGDRAKAKAAYQAFLALWKDADPHIPISKQVKAEYAKLQPRA